MGLGKKKNQQFLAIIGSFKNPISSD